MKLVIDMNLSPEWEDLFGTNLEAIHWNRIGEPDAEDSEILLWAIENQAVVLTSDLDFGDILAATNLESPSVIQLRSQVLDPNLIGKQVMEVIENHKVELSEGALISVDLMKSRVRKLPLGET